MELLTYPFHNPPAALRSPSPDAALQRSSSAGAGAGAGAGAAPTLHRSEVAPAAAKPSEFRGSSAPPLKDEASDRAQQGKAKNEGPVDDTYVSLPPPAEEDPEDGEDNGDDDDDESLVGEQDEAARIRRANEAFSKLRTADFTDADKIPTSWKTFDAPSLRKGHWRSYGPLQVRLFSIQDEDVTAMLKNRDASGDLHAESQRKLDRQIKRKIDKVCKASVSSACEGTLWITKDQLLFVLLEDTTTLSLEPEHEQAHTKSGKSISTWLKGLLKSSSSSKEKARAASQARNERVPEGYKGPLPEFLNGHPLSGFQIPLSTISQIYYRSPATDGREVGSSISRKSSLSPSLSRTSTRNSHRATPSLSRTASRKSVEAGDRVHSPDNPIIDLEPDDSQKVTVQAVGKADGGRIYRLEFSFMSKFYAGEPGDFVARLESVTQTKSLPQ